MARSMPAWDAGDHRPIRATLAVTVQRLARAGADFFACPDNTAHMALEEPGEDLALPGLHIAEVVADQAAADGHERIGVLGTIYTMDGPLYPRAFAARGIETEVPDASDRGIVNKIIFQELVNGVFTEGSRDEYVRIIQQLADRGCDAVALVCTEIPLLVTPASSPLPPSTSPSASAPCRSGAAGPPQRNERGGAGAGSGTQAATDMVAYRPAGSALRL
jgi:aspartate racemase